jgi:hypothetical protein
MKRGLQITATVITSGLLILLSVPSSDSQESGQQPWRQYSGDYTQIENVLTDLYRSVSFEPGSECDWDRLRMLCHENAVFFQPPARGTQSFRPFSLEGFIQFFKDDIERYNMKQTGFHERLGRHETTSYARIAHSYAVYEVRIQPDEPDPRQRGVDSIQLAFHEGRWWITAINTDVEIQGQPIPDSILRGGGNTVR